MCGKIFRKENTVTAPVPLFSKELQPPFFSKAGERQPDHDLGESITCTRVESGINSSKGQCSPLPKEMNTQMGSAMDADFTNVKIHTDSSAVKMNHEMQANAFTHGEDIYFNRDKYNTDTTQGKKLLAHELTHVVQQRQGVIQRNMIQRDLSRVLPLANSGTFKFDSHAIQGALAVPLSTQANLDVSINFMPYVAAPYSNEIKLFQIVRDRDTSGTDIDLASMPPGRGASLRTAENATTCVGGGFQFDVLHQDFGVTPPTVGPPRTHKSMAYEGGLPYFGFKRSNDPADIKAADITDSPGSAGNRNFEFETVAKSEDINQIYGALNWSFGTRSGTIIHETAIVTAAQSATFDAAAELHRDFCVHEPVVFYFDFDSDVVNATEDAKIPNFPPYFRRCPNVRLSLQGFADRRGDPSYNIGLSNRRAQHIKDALIRNGIPAANIETLPPGFGATKQFTSGALGPNAGRSQDLDANRRGNRRVVLTLTHLPTVTTTPPAPGP